MTTPLGPGSRLGAFEITARLGAGGMGEVWRARDTRLQRDVAIKVLPAALVGDPERRARFEREARVLASLNHPHIGALLALEEADGTPALVLELVDGPTLAERLSRQGAMPMRDVISTAHAIAEAMEYAHELGVVHRDLKPANIKFTLDDSVKVLDFGLAKALSADPEASADGSLTHSPTRTLGTRAGVLLGTAAYMSPEQARGKPVDRRADIWAFGVVVFEMLTGRQLFGGETASDAIARILEREPDWAALPAAAPPRLVELLRRCLEKDARKRLRDIGDARLELEAIAASATEPAPRTSATAHRSLWPIALSAVVALGAGLAAGIAWRGSGAEPAVRRLSVSLPPDVSMRMGGFAEGGRTLIGVGTRVEGGQPKRQLYRRPLDAFEWTPIAGTENTINYDFDSSDRWIYLVAPAAPGSPLLRLTRVPTDGSAPPSEVSAWSDRFSSWEVMPDGRILVVEESLDSIGVLTPGRTSTPRWQALRSQMPIEDMWLESVYDDGRKALATVGYFGPNGWTADAVSIDVASGDVTVLVAGASTPRETHSGQLLVGRGERLLAAPFDRTRGRITGEPVAVLENLMLFDRWGACVASISEDGTLLYRPAGRSTTQRRIATLDPSGRWQEWSRERHEFIGEFTASDDGRRLLATTVAPGTGSFEILVFDRDREQSRRLLPPSSDDKGAPLLAPDGRTLAFQRGGTDSSEGVYVVDIDGDAPPRRVVVGDRTRRIFHRPLAWLPDGRGLLLQTTANGHMRITRADLGATPTEPRDVISRPYDVGWATLSHDGRTLAFLSEESGQMQPWVVRFEAGAIVGAPVPVARVLARMLAWAPDRRTLWCFTGQPEAVGFDIGPDLRATSTAAPISLEGEAIGAASARPLAGGGWLVMRRADGESGPERFDLVFGFERELAQRLARARTSTR